MFGTLVTGTWKKGYAIMWTSLVLVVLMGGVGAALLLMALFLRNISPDTA